jgi:4-amino-4-deoxy-L-arabinose transferase-like glycosyltransferase
VSDHPQPGPLTRSDWQFRALLALACLVLYLAGSWRSSVFDQDEARFALAVKEMHEHGEWLVPSNWGMPRYNKPISSTGCRWARSTCSA